MFNAEAIRQLQMQMKTTLEMLSVLDDSIRVLNRRLERLENHVWKPLMETPHADG